MLFRSRSHTRVNSKSLLFEKWYVKPGNRHHMSTWYCAHIICSWCCSARGQYTTDGHNLKNVTRPSTNRGQSNMSIQVYQTSGVHEGLVSATVDRYYWLSLTLNLNEVAPLRSIKKHLGYGQAWLLGGTVTTHQQNVNINSIWTLIIGSTSSRIVMLHAFSDSGLLLVTN